MKVKVTQPLDKPIPAEVIAQSIVDISIAMKALNSTRLSRECIVALIYDNSKICKRDIRTVLENLSTLERTWLK